MSVPPRWAKGKDWQRIVAGEVNPLLQGMPFPRYDAAPSPAQDEGATYYDTALHRPAWYDGSAYRYLIGGDSLGRLTSLTVTGNATVGGTLGVTGATTLSSLSVTGNETVGGTLGVTGTTTLAAVTVGGLMNAQGILAAGVVLSSSQVGYQSGAGGTVTQTGSRTTAVTLNAICGAITLVSAAGSTTPASFTVNNSTMGANDTVILNQKSGTDKYSLDVTAKANGSFQITFNTKSGTTSEQPVFSFAIIKAVTT